MDPTSAREIEAAVQEALSLFATSGSVVVRGRQIELQGRGAPTAIDMEQLGEQWPLLPPDLRARKAGEIARRLVQAQRAVSSIAPPPPSAPKRAPRVVVVPFAAVALALVGLYFGVGLLRSREAPAPSSATPTETVEQTAARQARVCEAARKRIYAGASMGPFDVDGWVVEIWLATSRSEGAAGWPSGGEPPNVEKLGLGAFLDHGKLTKGADAEIAALSDGQLDVVAGLTDEHAAKSPSWRAVTVRMSSGYARGYFEPALRARFLSLADAMADSASAEIGALYARCAHLPYRDVGSWFRGSDAGAAATALVYGAGLFAELPAVDRGALDALRGPGQLDALRSAGAALDVGALGRLVGSHGGSITVSKAGAVVIAFPVGGPTRATSASRVVARRLGVGVGQD